MSGTRVLEANVRRQLLTDYTFVCSSCTDARRRRRCARRPLLLYPTLPSLPVIPSVTAVTQVHFL